MNRVEELRYSATRLGEYGERNNSVQVMFDAASDIEYLKKMIRELKEKLKGLTGYK